MMFMRAIMFLYGKLVALNLFPLRNFGNQVDQMRGKYLGRIATKLYIVLLLLGLIVLTLRMVISPDIVTKTIDKPSMNAYNRLLHDHDDTLQCSCSFISSIYDQYVTIEPIFHQVTNRRVFLNVCDRDCCFTL